MPILQVNATANGLEPHGSGCGIDAALRHALADDGGPITVMIHGYKYRPGDARHCPHASILSPVPAHTGPTILSWPRRLGLRGGSGEGVGIAFGWNARGLLWQAHREAGRAGASLAGLLGSLRRIAPGRPVRIVAHSMGARVALRAMALAEPGTVSRAVLLAAAEYDRAARAAMAAQGAGCAILNVTSRENDLFDFLVETLIPARRTRILGAAALRMPGLVHLQIDDMAALEALRGGGFPVAPAQRRICHWSAYRRPGLWPLYRAFLDGRVTPDALGSALPARTTPRWSRLLALPVPAARPATH